jgi:uncharacterized protein YndB with AHSA1/START domain
MKTQVRRLIKAPREKVYRALLDKDSVAHWRVPDGMTGEVHIFEPKVGGRFRVSLTYQDPAFQGKSQAHTDTYQGRFEELIPNQKVVEKTEFETSRLEMRGEMKITTVLNDTPDGTELLAVHENLPPGLSPKDNEIGWKMSLSRLAALVEDNTLWPVRHVSIAIRRSPEDVYAFTSEPRNLPLWAAGLAGSDLVKHGAEWICDSPMGRIVLKFAPPNSYGVMDHDVTLSTGEVFHNPLRVLPNHRGSEVVFTLYRRPEMTEESFAKDGAQIKKDLLKLKELLEPSGERS